MFFQVPYELYINFRFLCIISHVYLVSLKEFHKGVELQTHAFQVLMLLQKKNT